jgi:putative endonuclease
MLVRVFEKLHNKPGRVLMNFKILSNLVNVLRKNRHRITMRIHLYYVYILTNAHHSVLYVGVTNDLERRCFEHRQKKIKGFTQKYNVDKLIYFERFDFIDLAIAREKQIKGYSRSKKIALIDQFNKDWRELYCEGKIENPCSKSK